MHIMLDIETLSTRMDAAVLSIGACRFTADGIEDYTFYRAVTLDSNFGRHIAGGTLAWWVRQGDAARIAAFADPAAVHLSEALCDFVHWFRGAATSRTGDAEPVYLWGNGTNFDVSILESAYATNLTPPPWDFRNVRCLRTIRGLEGADAIERPVNPCPHNALQDAIAQAKWLQAAWAAGIGRGRD